MDLEQIRADTPGVDGIIHLNNAGASLQPLPVREAVRSYLDLEDAMGGYEAAAARQSDFDETRAAVGALIGAPPHTIAFQESSTLGFNQALSAIPFRPDDLILTSRHDYASNQIAYMALKNRFGVRFERVGDAPEGGVDPKAAAEMIHHLRPRVVAMSQIPTNSGLVQPLAPIGHACRQRGVLFLVDACQSIGQMPIDVDDLACDFLAASGRKFLRGPRGTGFLYVSERALDMGIEPLLPDLFGADWIANDLYQPAPDARLFETWESSWALTFGLGAAVRYALELGLPAIQQRAWELARGLRELLSSVPGIRVLDHGPELCAIVAVAVAGWDAADLMEALRERGVNTSDLTRVSAVLDFDAKGVETALRLSPHYFNSESEIEQAVGILGEVISGG
jgi:selenocysteine lyase/cysteine desulfurase